MAGSFAVLFFGPLAFIVAINCVLVGVGGAVAWLIGHFRAKANLQALEHGIPVQGQLTRIHKIGR
ncbi:MAG: hypothetical protein HN348_31535, partial [Proteobacteria bacterium]|nr:hypothetical protein [Pseudomonadota bacterium]